MAYVFPETVFASGNTLELQRLGIFEAKTYGAKGDGTSDDFTALQAMLNAAGARSGTAMIPPGTYLTSSALSVPSNVTVVGGGMDVTTIKVTTATTACNIASGASNVSIRDVTFNGNRAAFPVGGGVALGCSGGVTNLHLENVKCTNGQSFTFFLDTTQGGYTRGRIIGCIFEDSGQGLDTVGSGQLTDFIFTGCIFRNTTGQGLATTNSTGGMIVEGCHFEGPMGNAISGEPCSNIAITGCTFHNCNDVANAIFIRPLANLASDCVNITITGNLFYNTGVAAGTLMDSGIFLRNCSHVTISGNIIKRTGRAGIRFETATVTSSNGNMQEVVVTGNTVIDSNQDNAGATPNVSVTHGSGGTFSDVVIVGNTLGRVTDGFAQNGILESGTITRALYAYNNMNNTVSTGIGFGSGTTSRAYGNIGFNPQGAAAISVTASPFTYTNNDSVPEAVYIRAGTVSDISKNSTTLFAATPATVWLEPGEAVVVTYTVAPTMVKDRK